MFKKFFPVLMVCAACFCASAESKVSASQVPDAARTAVQSAVQSVPASEPAGKAPAQPAAENGKKNGKGGGSMFNGMLMPIILIVVMIFFFSRANKKQQQKRQEMLDRITKGTKVLLNSGVYGKIVEVRENEFLVEIAENVRVLVVKNGIANVEEEKKEAGK